MGSRNAPMMDSQPSRLTQTRSEKRVSATSTQRTSGVRMKESTSYMTARPTTLHSLPRGGESPRSSFEEEGEKRENSGFGGQLVQQASSPGVSSGPGPPSQDGSRCLEQSCPSY